MKGLGAGVLVLTGLAALWFVTKKPQETKAAAAIVAELLPTRPVLTQLDAAALSDQVAEAMGLSPTDPAPAKAVYEATGVVPAGHWAPPGTWETPEPAVAYPSAEELAAWRSFARAYRAWEAAQSDVTRVCYNAPSYEAWLKTEAGQEAGTRARGLVKVLYDLRDALRIERDKAFAVWQAYKPKHTVMTSVSLAYAYLDISL